MTFDLLMSRRAFLIGCSAAASPLLTPISFAAAPGENRLVVIILRGAMDGLDVVRPLGDPAFAALRPTLAADAATSPDLDGFFALNPVAAGLMPLWKAGDLAFAHAVATPYRVGRSHFIAQDALENGGDAANGALTPAGDGWLNRAVGLIPGAGPQTAVSVGQERMLILDGAVETQHWLPVEDSTLSAQGRALLAALNAADPLFAEPFAEVQTLVTESGGNPVPRGDAGADLIGGYVADRLRGEARIASFSFGGWDSHQNQTRIMADRLAALSGTILAMKAGLGPLWATTTVLAMTEFGRTARENGSAGTDHGTGGLLIAAGGAVKGGRVYGTWPGLGDGQLFEERDLLPTGDVRAYAAWALRDLYGLDSGGLAGTVFPGLDLGSNPGLIR